jgi:hypothetical protein
MSSVIVNDYAASGSGERFPCCMFRIRSVSALRFFLAEGNRALPKKNVAEKSAGYGNPLFIVTEITEE